MPAGENESLGVEAVRHSLAKGTAHAEDWLEGRDFKSLAQSADGLKTLAELLRAQSDDSSWQSAIGKAGAAASDLQTAARSQNEPAARAAIESIERALADSASLMPAGKAAAAPRGANVRSLMYLLDSVRADAKISLLAGDAGGAKKSARTLSLLGGVVSNARGGDAWKIMSDDFTAAARAAADSPSDDPNMLKPLFRTISESCDSCHDSR